MPRKNLPEQEIADLQRSFGMEVVDIHPNRITIT